ncbi:MAG: hypothetical protein L0J03_07225 [Brevibacterium sp.]|nr:hypothetical protein [Brevibacterium sp.]MDN6527511.1 hypothetical protein [Brevibacterium sp.]
MTRNEMSEEDARRESSECKDTSKAEPAEQAAARAADDEQETAQQRKARLEAALRKYRATLRNEAETADEGFSAGYYKSQKPPHW